MTIILITATCAFVLAFCLGTALGFFKEVFAVEEDPLVSQIREALPGVNCGACGFPGCDGLAGAIAQKTAEINACPVGGESLVKTLSALVGGNAELKPEVVFVACQGGWAKAPLRGEYLGVNSCRAAVISAGSVKRCTWGCQGYGDCVKVCKFDAITMNEDGIPVVDTERCTGCKVCVAECPQRIIHVVPKGQKAACALCYNQNPIKAMVGKTCKAGCIKCELCVKNCPENCLTMVNGIPEVNAAACTACGVCVSKCPTKVMVV